MNNKEIYQKWCEYQEKNNMPKPACSIEVYTQDTISLWKRILKEV